MSGFWEVEGKKVEAKDTVEVEGGGGNGMPIPAGTNVKIVVADAKWETGDRDGTYINLKHQVLQPECYKGRVIFQKLHVRCHEFASAANNVALSPEKLSAKRAKALRMLATIDTNAGGKLLSSPSAPDDAKLQQCLVGKTMSMELDVYEFDMKDGVRIANPVDYMRGNWVRKVAPKEAFTNMSKEDQLKAVEDTDATYKKMLADAGGVRAPREDSARPAAGAQTPQRTQAPRQQAADFDAFDDDIPF